MSVETHPAAAPEDPAVWHRPEALASHLGVTVRTLRKWVSKGRAERTRGHRGEVYYRLTEPLGLPGPVPSGAGPDPLGRPAAQRDHLQEQVTAALEGFESARKDNAMLRRELDYERELAALPWWARRRRRELTLPMLPLDVD